MTGRQFAVLLAGTVLAVTAGLGLYAAGRSAPDGPSVAAARTTAVERELRCPVCVGESIAESRTATAAAMRAQVTALAAQGRSPGQIRDWFAARYGRTILLLPPARGADLLLWLVPVAPTGLLIGCWALRRPGPPATSACSGPCPPDGSRAESLQLRRSARRVAPRA